MKKLLVILLSLMMLFGIFAATASAADISFTDVKPADWFYNDVKNAVNMGLVNGKSATIYAPNDNMTYAEATKLAACMYEKYTTGRVTLGNSTTGNWYDSYVEYARANGIISGNYNWNGAASRAGYMAIFAHALPESAFTAINNVPDNSIPDVGSYSYYGPDIYKLYRAGIVQGVDAKFNCDPDSNIKRSEVAAILTRMMDPSARKTFSTAPGTALTIATQPQNLTVNVGEKASFSVTVSGGKPPYSYQWRKIKPDGSDITPSGGMYEGLTSATMADNDPFMSDNGAKYYCVVTDADGNKVTSEKALLTVGSGLTITTQPANATISAGGNATFTVAASGGTQPYTYEWHRVIKVSNYDLKITQDEPLITGTKTASLTTKNCQGDENGDQYYCVIRDANGNSVTSDKATLTVGAAALTITSQPANATINAGGDATFTVTVSGGTTPYKYEWHRVVKQNGNDAILTDGGLTPGATTYKLTTKQCAATENGDKYYCVITDANGNKVTSNKATLTVNAAALTITTQPKSVTAAVGSTVTMSVSVSGGTTPYKYQWYKISPGSSESSAFALSEGGAYSGVHNPTMSASNTTVGADDGCKYYCVITDANNNTVKSNKATVTVQSSTSPLKITKQPSNTSVFVGKDAYFSITVSGGTPPYSCSWWKVPAGSSAFEIDNSTWYSGYKTTNLIAKKVYKTSVDDGAKFYCVVKDAAGNTVTSNKATLTVKDMDVTIPSSKSIKKGGSVYISATVQGGFAPLKYQWFYGPTSTNKMTESTAQTGPDFSITIPSAVNYKVFCYVTDDKGNEAGSNMCYITVSD